MQITIICVGKMKKDFFTPAHDEYVKRLSKYCKLDIVEVEDEKAPDGISVADENIIKVKEAQKIVKHIKSRAYIVVLAIEGKQKTSEQFANFFETKMASGCSHIIFIIGGSLGLDYNSLSMANEKLSFSSMTFPHQLMRVVLLEQIFRSFKILSGEPYHK